MNELQRQTEFLRQCLLYEESTEHQKLAEAIRLTQRNERCVRRALWMMATLATLALAGLGYLMFSVPDFPQDPSRSVIQFLARAFCVLGLGSLICIPAFIVLEMMYRKDLNARREECRLLVASLLESRLGKPARQGAQNDQNGSRPVSSDRKAARKNPRANEITGRRFEI